MNKPKRGAYSLKRLLSGLMIILLSYSLISAGESKNRATQNLKSSMTLEELKAETNPTPLAIRPLFNLNLFFLYPQSPYDFNLKSQYNINLKKSESSLIPSLAKISRLNDLEKSFYTGSLVTLIVLNAADWVSTISALKHEGLQEANPLMKPFSKNAWLLMAVKAGVSIYNYHFLKNLYRKNKKLAWIISLTANMAMTYIVVNNFRMIHQASSR